MLYARKRNFQENFQDFIYIYQVTQAKGVGATQYASQYQAPTQQQGGYNSSKYSGNIDSF